MMQSCASAAKLRSGGPILPIGMKAKGHVGIPPPRTIIGAPSQANGQDRNCRGNFSILHSLCRTQNDAVRYNALPNEPPGQSEACAPRPRSWSCGCRGRSRCGLETNTSPSLSPLSESLSARSPTALGLTAFNLPQLRKLRKSSCQKLLGPTDRHSRPVAPKPQH